MLVFYSLPQSPYCSKVRAALKLKNLPFEEREPHGGSYQTTEYQSVVPAGSVPAIELDGWVLHDSQAILAYLEERYPSPSLWSDDERVRALQRSLVNYHDSKIEPVVRELVPLVKQPPSAEKTLLIGVVRDKLFDRLYRLQRIMASDLLQDQTAGSVVDWTLPPTIYMAMDVLDYLGLSIKMPDGMENWLEQLVEKPLVNDEVACVRGAIAQWLRNESVAVN